MATPKVTSDVEHLLETAADHDQLDANIFLRREPTDVVPMSGMAATTDTDSAATDMPDVVDQLKAAAKSAQAGLLSFLNGQTDHAAFTDDGVSVMAAAAPE